MLVHNSTCVCKVQNCLASLLIIRAATGTPIILRKTHTFPPLLIFSFAFFRILILSFFHLYLFLHFFSNFLFFSSFSVSVCFSFSFFRYLFFLFFRLYFFLFFNIFSLFSFFCVRLFFACCCMYLSLSSFRSYLCSSSLLFIFIFLPIYRFFPSHFSSLFLLTFNSFPIFFLS